MVLVSALHFKPTITGNVTAYVSVPYVASMLIGTSDFTFERWHYLSLDTNFPQPVIFSLGTALAMSIDNTVMKLSINGTIYNTTVAAPDNTWIQVTISRSSGIIHVYQTGVLSLTVNAAGVDIANTSLLPLLIGNNTTTPSAVTTNFNGWILDFTWTPAVGKPAGPVIPAGPPSSAVTSLVQLLVSGLGQIEYNGSLGLTATAHGDVDGDSSINVPLIYSYYSGGPGATYIAVPYRPTPSNATIEYCQCHLSRNATRFIMAFGKDPKKMEKPGYPRAMDSIYGTLGRRRR